MIKRIFGVLLVAFYAMSGFCSEQVHVDGEAVQEAIEAITTDENKKYTIASLYNEGTKDGAPLTFETLTKICNGALDADKDKCEEFSTKLLSDKEASMHSVCDQDKGKTNGKEFCVDFTKYTVSETAALKLAEVYAKYKINPEKYDFVDPSKPFEEDKDIKIKCSVKHLDNDVFLVRGTRRSDIFCDANKNAQNYYFQFKLSTKPEIIDYDAIFDIFQAVCDMRNGQWFTTGPTCITETQMQFGFCKWRLDKMLEPFGYKTYVNQITKGCSLDNHKLEESELVNEIPGLDPRAFFKLQLRYDKRVVGLLTNYTQKKLTKYGLSNFGVNGFNELNFHCDAAMKSVPEQGTSYFTPPSARGTKLAVKTDNSVRCYITSHANCAGGASTCDKAIDFIFDDLTEAYEYKVDAGFAGLECLADGGNFGNDGFLSGSGCYGLDKDQCLSMGAKMRNHDKTLAGTRWNEEEEVCELLDTATSETMDVVSGIALEAIGVLAAVATFPASAGITTIIVAGAGLTAWVAGDAVAVYQFMEAKEINTEINKCGHISDSRKKHDCAMDVITKRVVGKDFSKWSVNEQTVKALEASIEAAANMIDPEYGLETMAKICKTDTSDDCVQGQKVLDAIVGQVGNNDPSVVIGKIATAISFLCFAAGAVNGATGGKFFESVDKSLGTKVPKAFAVLGTKFTQMMGRANVVKFAKIVDSNILDYKYKFNRVLQIKYGIGVAINKAKNIKQLPKISVPIMVLSTMNPVVVFSADEKADNKKEAKIPFVVEPNSEKEERSTNKVPEYLFGPA